MDFETVVVETDVLILGGGMAACGAAVEAAYWSKKLGLSVALVDKATGEWELKKVPVTYIF